MADPTYLNWYGDHYNHAYANPPQAWANLSNIFAIANVGTTHDIITVRLNGLVNDTPLFFAVLQIDASPTITIAHMPMDYVDMPGVPHTTMNDRVVLLVGSDPRSLTSIVLPDGAFNRVQLRTHIAVADTLAAVTAAAPNNDIPSLTTAPMPATEHQFHTRRVMLLPAEWAMDLLNHGPFLSTLDFHAHFLAGHDAAYEATYHEVYQWWQGAVTLQETAGGGADHQALCITPDALNAIERHTLANWTNSRVQRHMRQLGMTTAAVTAGINNAVAGLTDIRTGVDALRTTFDNHEAARAAAKSTPKSFTDKYGAQASALLCTLTMAPGDDALPELLRQLANCKDKSTEMATIDMCLHAASTADPHINQVNMPRASPHLLALLRIFNLIGTGTELGSGLNPYSVTCQGHPQSKSTLELAEQQASIEAGSNSMTLADAAAFKVKDARFPRTLIQVNDKCRAFKIQLQVILGDAHPYVNALNTGLNTTLPHILQLESSMGHNKKLAMMYGLRYMLWIQQSFFLYLRKVRDGVPAPALPDFHTLADDLEMGMYDKALPSLPTPWMETVKSQLPEYFNEPQPSRIRGGGPGTATPGSDSNTRPARSTVINTHKDEKLIAHFTASGKVRIAEVLSQYTGEGNPPIPTYNNKPVCLSWAYKGKCHSDCPRCDTHKHYGAPIVKKLHELLTTCQVANPQE